MLTAKLAVDFSQNVTFCCECNCVRIGQNIENEVSLERPIFGKLNASRKEDMHRSIWKENDKSSRRRVKIPLILTIYGHLAINLNFFKYL